MKRVILLILAIELTRQQCKTGCLKCSSSNTCSICDTTNLFYLSQTTCVLFNKTNCAVIDQSGNCITCNAGYSLDTNSNGCLSIPAPSLVPNCLIYNSGQACTGCLPNYFITSGSCSIVNITIPFCQSYIGNGVCGACMSNYTFAPDYMTCVPLQTIPNCLSYTYVGCKNCTLKYIYNQNLFALNYNNIGNMTLFLSKAPISQAKTALSVCQATNILNCLNYTTYNICSACATGYYLSNNTCVINPIATIANCLTYSSLTLCQTCQVGFYLSGTKCIVNPVIPGCQAYDNTATSNTCVRCNTTAYLNNNGCKNRTVSLSIPSCLTTSLNTDTCSQCNPGYNLTSDSVGCLSMISNCAVYATSVSTQTQLSCSVCSPGFYVVSNTTGSFCVAGTITNCQVYTSNANTCATCTNGFYKSGNACLTHIFIQNCLQYSQSSVNQCSVCNVGFYNFLFSQICVAVTSITNCAQYSTNGLICNTCLSGFYLTNSNTCVQIPNSYQNCQTLSNSICTSCQSGYVLNVFSSNNLCTPYVDYVLQSCDTGTTTTSGYCSICPVNSYYYLPKQNEAICVLTSDLINFSSFSSVSQCVRYGLNSASTPSIVCMECSFGFFLTGYWPNRLTATSTSCLSTCSTADGTNIIIPDDLYGSVNICVQTGVASNQIYWPGCQRIARYTTFNNGQIADYNCMSPTGVYSPLFTTNAATGFVYESYSLSAASVLNADTANNSVDFVHGFSFIDTNATLPRIFNYKGISFNVILSSTVNPQTALMNCDVLFQLGSAGSVYQSGGAQSGGYAVGSGAVYSCLRCNYGFQPVFSITGATGNVNTPVCQSMGNLCWSSTIFYGGLPSFLNAALSCHNCTTIAGVVYYPTLYFEYDATTANGYGVFLQYSMPAIVNSAVTPNHGFRCSGLPATIAVSSSTPTTGNQVTQCVIYGVFSAQVSGNQTPTVFNTFCLACASGFYPIYLAVSGTKVSASPVYAPPYIVTSCVKSNKCDPNPPNLPFNSCGRCSMLEQILSPPIYYAYSDYRLINCLPVVTPNCLIISPSAPSTSVASACLICLSGFYLNVDGYCDFIVFPNFNQTNPFVFAYFANKQSSFTGSKVTGFDIAWSRIHYILSFSGLQYGARSCLPGYVRAPASTVAPGLCVNSTYLASGVYYQGTKFISNCLKFNFGLAVSGVYSCKVCASGFIPTSTNLLCVTQIANCLQALASSTTLCNICQSGYINLSGVCSTSTISNCISYQNTVQYNSGLTSLTCTACANRYYLQTTGQGTTCLLGSILNCATYSGNSATNCLTCLPNFNLLLLTNSVIYCYPIPGAFSNCQMVLNNAGTGGVNGFKQGYINCNTCSQTGSVIYGIALWSSLVTTNQPQSICMPFSLVSNCATYDQGNSLFAANSFLCTSCTANFFYQASNNTCIQRVNMDPNCIGFSGTLDQCTTCASGYFLNSTKTSCIIYPFGIPFCTVYSSATVCVSCALNYYLANNTCLLSTLISNCIAYSANFTCTNCSFGNFLSNNTCVTPNANGCVTYVNISACASCTPGFGLLASSSSIDCVDSSIQNCLVTNTVSPFVCLTCQTGYFPDIGGICSQVAQTISNCLVYDTNVTCIQCVSGAVLAASKTFCDTFTYNALIDPRCTFSYVSANPMCAVCSPGSYFVNGICTSVVTGVLNGCLATDPLNFSNCLLCKPGYYQISSGTCLQAVVQINTTINNQTNFTASSYRIILKISMGLLLVAII